MSATIYDSSLLTRLKASKTESKSFITRQSGPNPTTSYGPALGIWDQSIVNDVKIGQMTEFRKCNGSYVTFNGCPCNLTSSE